MVIELDMESEVPIYVQLRNQIVKGIGKGELKAQEKLPTVRQLAAEAGVNTMTVNKAYQILKAEGYIKIDRRHGAVFAVQGKAGSGIRAFVGRSQYYGNGKGRVFKAVRRDLFQDESVQTILKSEIFA